MSQVCDDLVSQFYLVELTLYFLSKFVCNSESA